MTSAIIGSPREKIYQELGFESGGGTGNFVSSSK